MNSRNEIQIAMKIRSKAKPGSYQLDDVNEGDKVRIQMLHMTPKGSSNNGAQSYIHFRKTIIMEYIRLMRMCILEKKYN